MDEDDIYGSILSDPKSNSISNLSNNYPGSVPQYHQNQSHHMPQSHSQVSPQSSLFIANMTWWTSEDDLKAAFGDLSHRILQIQFLEHKPNGKSKGMVIVEFGDVQTAELAKKSIEGREMVGKRVWEVSFARNAPVRAYERPHQPRNDYVPRDQQVNRLPPRPIRTDQQYHQRPERTQHEISYDEIRNERVNDYHPHPHSHQPHQQVHSYSHQYQNQHPKNNTRHVHREESGGNDRRSTSRPSLRESDRRDSRSKSPNRRSSSHSGYYDRKRH